MGSIKFNTNRTKVELTGITETESSTLSGKGKQTSVLPTYKPNFKDVNLTTIQAQARTPVFKSVTTPRKYTTPTQKPKIELPKYTPFTQEEVGLLQHQTRLPMALPKSNLTSKAATNTEYALKSNPTAYGFMEGFSPLATKKQLSKQLGQEIDATGAEDTLGYKVGYGAGLMGQYAITGGIAHAGVRQGLTRMIPQLANQAGRSTVKNVLGTMGASALTDVLTGVPVNTLQAIKESTIGDNVNWNQFAKSFAVNTAIDVVFGGLIEGVLVLKSGKKIKTVGDLKTVTPDESKEITEQLMLNSPKYKENLMLNAPTNKLLNIPQKQLTHPIETPKRVYAGELPQGSKLPENTLSKKIIEKKKAEPIILGGKVEEPTNIKQPTIEKPLERDYDKDILDAANNYADNEYGNVSLLKSSDQIGEWLRIRDDYVRNVKKGKIPKVSSNVKAKATPKNTKTSPLKKVEISIDSKPSTNTVTLYHGTNRTDLNTLKQGSWLTPEKGLADEFAGYRTKRKKGTATTHEIEISLDNKKIVDFSSVGMEDYVTIDELSKALNIPESELRKAYDEDIVLKGEGDTPVALRYITEMPSFETLLKRYKIDGIKGKERFGSADNYVPTYKFFNEIEIKPAKAEVTKAEPKSFKGTPTKLQKKIPTKAVAADVTKTADKPFVKVAKAEPKVTTTKSEGVFVDYYPGKRAIDVTKSTDYHQITKEANYKPDDYVTIYRGAPDVQTKITDGDWVSTSKQLAKDYAGTGKVIEDKVQAKHLYAPKGEGIEELIYSTKATKIPTKPQSVEAELKSLTAEMKVTPPTETQIKRYKQLKAQVKPAKIPTREPVSTVEPVKPTKPTLTPKPKNVASNVTKTDNVYFDTISNATEKTKAEKRLSEPITFVDNKGNITKATRKEYIEDIAMIDGSQIKTTQKLRTNGGKTFEVNEYRVYKTPSSKEPIKISKYEKDYFDFAKKNQDNVVQSVTPYKKPIKKVDKSLPPKNTTNPIDLVMASSKKVQKGFKESVIDRGLEVKRKFVDSGDTVAIIGKITGDKGLYHSYNKARSSTRSAEHVLGEAQTNIIGDKVGESLKDIFKPIRKKGDGYYNDFQLYLLHKHNVDRMAQGKPVFGEDITADISIAEANKLLKEYPEFEALSQKIYKFNKNNMQYRVDADLITAEQAKMFEEMYPHYVPTIRAKKSVPQPPKNSKTDVTGKIAKTIKEATGDSSPILPLHQSMARQTMQTVTAAEKNIFANRLIKNVTPETSRYIQDMNSIIKDFDLDSELVNAMKSKKESEELKNYFTLFRNGEAYQVKVDEGLFEGLEALTSSNRSTDAIIDAVTAGNTMFKQLITGYSPTFLVRNGARDLQDVGIYSKNLREFAIQYPKAIKEMTSNGVLWQRYKALGGTGSSFFDYAKGFKKDPTFLRKNTLNKIENLNMAVEQLPRFTEFMATLSKGDGSYDNLLEALYNSADITVNFGRAGTWGKTLNQTFVPFFNPAMQGFDKLARTLKYTKGWKDWTKLTIKATALGITPALINEIVYSDDPDYANLYSRDKDINYLFKLDNNVWIRIPKGRVLSLIGGAAQRTVRLSSGDKDAYAGFLKVAKEQVAPISPFESNIVSPILAVQNNKAWHGGTIEPQRLTGSAGLRYDESTTIPAKWLGAKLNYSPKKIDYLVDAYTGIIGDLAIPLTTPKAEVHPFAKAFTIDGATTNRISQDFYDKKTEISESYSDNKDNTSYIQNRYLNKQSDMASELFEEIRTVQNSKLTDVQKRTKVREIRALINVIEKNALDSLPEVEKTTKKLVNKYPDTDDLYREVNREVFGSEYALKLYNKTVYEKAQTYVTEKAAPSFNKNVATIPQKNGITWDNYYDGYFAQKDETSDISKAVALQGKNITTLYDAFGISDKNANIAAALSKNDLGKAYNTTYQKISNSEATKSAEKIAIIKQNNPTLSTSELRILYEAFNVAESIGGYTRKYS